MLEALDVQHVTSTAYGDILQYRSSDHFSVHNGCFDMFAIRTNSCRGSVREHGSKKRINTGPM